MTSLNMQLKLSFFILYLFFKKSDAPSRTQFLKKQIQKKVLFWTCLTDLSTFQKINLVLLQKHCDDLSSTEDKGRGHQKYLLQRIVYIYIYISILKSKYNFLGLPWISRLPELPGSTCKYRSESVLFSGDFPRPKPGVFVTAVKRWLLKVHLENTQPPQTGKTLTQS